MVWDSDYKYLPQFSDSKHWWKSDCERCYLCQCFEEAETSKQRKSSQKSLAHLVHKAALISWMVETFGRNGWWEW